MNTVIRNRPSRVISEIDKVMFLEVSFGASGFTSNLAPDNEVFGQVIYLPRLLENRVHVNLIQEMSI